MPEIRLLLGEKDFQQLVSGGIVEATESVRGTLIDVKIALSDIGFKAMTFALRDAIEDAAVGDNRPANHIFEDIVEPGMRPVDATNEPVSDSTTTSPEEGE